MNTVIDEQSMVNIVNALPDRMGTSVTIFDDYPDLLLDTTRTDIEIGNTSTNLETLVVQ